MMNLRISLGVAAMLSLAACDNDPVGDAAKAQTSEAAPAAPSPSAADAVKLTITEANSSLGFVGAKITDKHEGTLEKISGSINYVKGAPEKSTVSVGIDMNSLSIAPPKLADHLKSPDFFDVAKFPQARFESTKVEKSGNGYSITGNLTLRGVTKSITFPATIEPAKDSVSVSAEFGINRKDFGIVYPGMPDDLIKDEVLIKLRLDPDKA